MKKNNLNISDRAKNGRNGIQLVYVLDCIRNSSRATDEGKEFANDSEVLKFFFDIFDEEFNGSYNKKYYPNLQDRISHYLQGLPSCFAVEYWNDEIIKLGVSWGVLNVTEGRKADDFCLNWFNVLAFRILQAAQKVGINTFKYSL